MKIFQKFTKKHVFLMAAIMLLALLSYLFFSGKQADIPQYTEVIRRDVVEVVSSAGAIDGKSTASLKFGSSGKIASVSVNEGDIVYQNQVLAELDIDELSINVQKAENNLRDKQASLDKTIDDIKLFQYGNPGFGDSSETMAQRQLRTQAEVAKDNAYDDLRKAKKALEDAVITAPFGGIILEANYREGQNAEASDAIFKISDISEIYFNAEVDEADISRVSVGQKAEVTLDAYADKIFKGTVAEIIPSIKTTSSGAKVVAVKIKFEEDGIIFLSGLSGQASIIIDKAENVLIIPNDALVQNYVFVKKDKGFERRQVETGLSSDDYTEVKNGLYNGESVLKNPPSFVTKRAAGRSFFRMIFRP